MVGGYSFERSKFNRATQALPPGRLVVQAVRLHRGDRPRLHAGHAADGHAGRAFPAAPGQPPYAPMNYDREFEGPITLRRALEQSRNVPAVRLMDQLGPKQVIAYARRLGIESPLPPYLAVALGAAEATLLEMTSAYSVFPNQGVRMRPYSVLKVTDREGNVLEENRPEPQGCHPRRHRLRHDQPAARRRPARHRGARPRRSTGRSAARPARPTTTPTPGSSASIRTSRSASGWATTRRSRSATAGTGAERRCRSGSTS